MIVSKNSSVRIAVFSTHPTQYHAQLWRGLAENEGVEVRVLYATDSSLRGYLDREFDCEVRWDQPLTAGVDSRFLTDENGVSFRKPRVDSDAIDRALKGFVPDVAIMTAYSKRYWWDVYSWISRHSVALVLRTEASDVAGKRGILKAWLRDAVLRGFYGKASAVCFIGTHALRHFRRLGIPVERCFFSPYCVDTDLFESQYQHHMPRRGALRAEAGIQESSMVFVFSGKLVGRKNPMLIIDALRKLSSEERSNAHLIVAGDGPLSAEFCEAARALLAERYHFLGFMNQGELGKAYAMADCLILPSAQGFHETWGLVVNEAMQFGCAVIVSDAVGCHVDLVNASTGYVFPSGDSDALAGSIQRMLQATPSDRADYRSACRDHIRAYSNEAAVEGLVRAAMFASGRTVFA